MSLKRILTLIFIISVIPSILNSQTNPGNVVIRTNPAGASVKLDGDLILSGISPSRFTHPLIGKYNLTVTLPGYEKHRSKIVVDPQSPIDMTINLVPKTRFKAFARSIFIPGWGQRYSDKKVKGFVYTLLSVSSATAYFIADNKYDDKYNRLNDLNYQYDRLTSSSERRAMYPLLVEAQKDAYDAETVRRYTIGIAIGIWSVNLLDALFFFPDNKSGVSIKSLSLTPEYKNNTTGVKLSFNF